MRRVKTSYGVLRFYNTVTIAVRDYRLMLAVVRAADKWSREKGHITELADAIIAFNAKGAKKS